MAVDERFQGQGIGKLLLRAMLEIALNLRNQVGCAGVVVDTKSDAVEFYSRLGFVAFDVGRGALGDRPSPGFLRQNVQDFTRKVLNGIPLHVTR